jgi:hypothetical protein
MLAGCCKFRLFLYFLPRSKLICDYLRLLSSHSPHSDQTSIQTSGFSGFGYRKELLLLLLFIGSE